MPVAVGTGQRVYQIVSYWAMSRRVINYSDQISWYPA